MNLEILTLLFTAVVSISTVVYVILTGTLVSETRKMRKNQVVPHLIAYLDITETNARIAYIKLKNIGLGVALDVKFRVLKELDYPTARRVADYTYFKDGVKYFPPDHLDKFLLLSVESTYESITNDSLILEIEYKTILSEKKKHTYELRLNELIGKGILKPPDTHLGNIGYRLENIEKLLKAYIDKISKNSRDE